MIGSAGIERHNENPSAREIHDQKQTGGISERGFVNVSNIDTVSPYMFMYCLH